MPPSFELNDKDTLPLVRVTNAAGLVFSFLRGGGVFSLMKDGVMINQALGSPLETGLGGLWARVRGKSPRYFPVTGPATGGAFSSLADGVEWSGKNGGLAWSTQLRLAAKETAWFWTVTVKNETRTTVPLDAVLAQDLGLGDAGFVRNNEAYAGQYTDHTVLPHPAFGPLLCSRQSQKQSQGFPWTIHGCLDKAVGWLCDGFQFYGLTYKETGVPEALKRDKFPSRRLQYEFAMAGLQAKTVRLAAGRETSWTFFGLYADDHPAATGPRDAAQARRALAAWKSLPPLERKESFSETPSLFTTAPLLSTRNMTDAELANAFGPARRHEEKGLSFFCGESIHVATKKKELLLERPHGHILRSGNDLLPSDDALATTAWGYGAFHSHVTVGNTSFNKLLSISRNPLNVLRSGGQRIFVDTPSGWALLGVPSAFSMGPDHAEWRYKTPDGMSLRIRTFVSARGPQAGLDIFSEDGPHQFLISHGLALGNHEWDHRGTVEIARGGATFRPKGFMADHYPDASFRLTADDPAQVEAMGGDELLFNDGQRRGTPVLTLLTRPVEKFSLTLTGTLAAPRPAAATPEEGFWRRLRQNARLSHPRQESVSKINDLIPWYAHNALIHFTSPHGLEQYGGAAWGLRDVCQGPAEFLSAFGHFDVLKDTLKTVFSHQDPATGDWPQWFMFDRYRKIRAGDSHGDIIIWPIKALCDYVEGTGDFPFLDEPVPYTDPKTSDPTLLKEPLWTHVDKEIAGIHAGCVGGTALYHYGHGDWEDTLQPADPRMRDSLVSPWTVAIAYQTLRRWARLCRRAGRPEGAARVESFCDRIRNDFNRHLMPDGVTAGLALFRGKKWEPLLHPRDKKTGIRHRLLPMTRGIIAGLFTPAQAAKHLTLIRKHLLFPDGVRLTDKPVRYRGGVETRFKRAESAANFGREIGMQYVHAHIRYIEALAALGEAEDAWKALLAIVPITLHKEFPAAAPRQSNAYFSSSDAGFPDRYAASERFGDIKKLKVPIKGGWRVYSSGPGIYLGRLFSDILGIKRLFDDLIFDPVLPKKLDGLTLDIERDGREVKTVYHVKKRTSSPERITVNGRPLDGTHAENPYRRGGFQTPATRFNALLDRPENLVEIFL